MVQEQENGREDSSSSGVSNWHEQTQARSTVSLGSSHINVDEQTHGRAHREDTAATSDAGSAGARLRTAESSPAQGTSKVSGSSAHDSADFGGHHSASYTPGKSANNGSHDESLYQSPSAPLSASASPGKSGPTILMASRKQNSACDACRSRKVRCNRDPGEAKCNHCKAKNIDCTTLYVQWATSSSKRPTKRARTSVLSADEKKEMPKPPEIVEGEVLAQDRLLDVIFQRDKDYTSTDHYVYSYSDVTLSSPISPSGYTKRKIMPAFYLPGPKPAATTNAELHLLDRQRREDFVNDMIETYFSVIHVRMPLLNPQRFRRQYYERSADVGGPPSDVLVAIVIAWGAKFSENPLIAQDRSESAQELQKAYSQAEAALMKGEAEKAEQITGIKGGIDQPILTVPEELRNHGRNRIADHLLWRAQEVMESSHFARVPTLENVQACIMLGGMLSHHSIYYNGNLNLAGKPVPAKHRSYLSYTNGHWYTIAIKHLLDLGINNKDKVMAIKDPALRGEAMFTWWMTCACDSFSCMYFQRRCTISREDYNCDPPAGNGDRKTEAAHPFSSLDSYLEFFGSMHEALYYMRKIANLYFIPRSHDEGVPLDAIIDIVEAMKKWRVDHLDNVGVPLPHWPPHWDYIAAVSACTSDIHYHCNWVVLWRLVDEMGIYGTDRSNATSPIHQNNLKKRPQPFVPREDGPDPERVKQVVADIQEEALNGALRIAGLTEILRSNQYLRLDPANSLQSLEQASYMLIRFQRSEIDILVAGFRQYGLSYEDCFDKADLMEKMAAAYQERARIDPSFVPGSALGLALDRDAASAEHRGIPELAIAAALSNAAASANGTSGQYDYETSSSHPTSHVVVEQQDVKGLSGAGSFDGIFAAGSDRDGALHQRSDPGMAHGNGVYSGTNSGLDSDGAPEATSE